MSDDRESLAMWAAWRDRVMSQGAIDLADGNVVQSAIECAYAAGWNDGKWYAMEEAADSEEPDGPPTSDPEELIARLLGEGQ